MSSADLLYYILIGFPALILYITLQAFFEGLFEEIKEKKARGEKFSLSIFLKKFFLGFRELKKLFLENKVVIFVFIIPIILVSLILGLIVK